MELPEEDQPPEEIWLNTKLVNEHFEQLARDRKRGTDRTEKVPMIQNEITAGLRG